MNERVKEVRQALGLSGAKFGESIGLQRSAISKIERGAVGLSEANILSICREYNVNEDWLRTGEGEMFRSAGEISLDELADRESVDDLEMAIIQAYFSIDKDLRREALAQFKKSLGR